MQVRRASWRGVELPHDSDTAAAVMRGLLTNVGVGADQALSPSAEYLYKTGFELLVQLPAKPKSLA